jgi:hypothetical protein
VKVKRVLGLAAVLSLASVALAQTSTSSQAGIDSDITLLRSDIQAQRTDVVTHSMQLDDTVGKAFWPLYREYSNKEQIVGDQRVSVIKEYADAYYTMDDAKADALEARMLKFEQDRTKLKAEYYPKFKKAVGAKVAAKFFQVDNRLNLLIDLQIASVIPVLE